MSLQAPEDGPTAFRAAQPADARRRNTAALLRTVLDKGRVSRGEIAATLGLSQGTVSKIVGPIMASGVLRELPGQHTGGGRPKVPLDLDASSRLAVGLHLGSRRTTVGVVDLRGRGRSVTMENRSPDHAGEVLTRAAEMIRALVNDEIRGQLLGVGVTATGWVDPATGTVRDSGPLGWRDVPVGARLAAELDLPVLVESEVRAQAGAELWFGRAHRNGCTVHLSVGATVDAALVFGDVVHTGVRSAAGRVGHLPVAADGYCAECGRDGCLLAVATDDAVLAEARSAGLIGEDDGIPELAAEAGRGNTKADGLLVDRARHVGRAIAHLVDLLDPELVLLSGSLLTRSNDLNLVRVELATLHQNWDVEQIRPSALGRNASVNSAAALVLGAYFTDPLSFDTFDATPPPAAAENPDATTETPDPAAAPRPTDAPADDPDTSRPAGTA